MSHRSAGAIAIALVAVVAGARPATSQSPVITPAGDPTIQSDTIYALAADSSRYPDESYIYLLDDGVVRYEADGRGVRTYRTVVQILRNSAVAVWAERRFSYSPGHEKLTVNWIRVVGRDGAVISEAPTQMQDADVPAATGDPVYTDEKVRRYSLSRVTPGSIVDISYSVEELKPFLPGDFYLSWTVQNARLTRRSRYVLDLPKRMSPHLVMRNLASGARIDESNGRRVSVWSAQEVAKPPHELYASDSNQVVMAVLAGGTTTWGDVGKWYAGLEKGRDSLTPPLAARLATILADARSPADTIQAVYRFVAQDIRYVSIDLGLGGYQPRTAIDVLSTGYGDCKDKANLFIALVHALGFRAFPVLLNAGGTVERNIPSIRQFNHAIAVVDRPGGRQFVDLTSELTPFGELPPGDQGVFGLVVHPDGATEQVTLPKLSVADNLAELHLVGSVDSTGTVSASFIERVHGLLGAALRRVFQTPFDSTKRALFARGFAAKMFPGGTVDSVQLFDGRDLQAEALIALHVTRWPAVRSAGSSQQTRILTLPTVSKQGYTDNATTLEEKVPRVYPIDAGQVVGLITDLAEVDLTLPPGWQVELPSPVEVRGKWGVYSARYEQEGQTLHIRHRIEGAPGIYPQQDVADLVAWLRAVAKDDVPYLIIDVRPAGT